MTTASLLSISQSAMSVPHLTFAILDHAWWQHPQVPAGIAMAVPLLAVFCLSGLALVPPLIAAEQRLLQFVLRLASGMLFTSGVTATLCLQRLCYMTLIPAVQIAAAILLHRRTAKMPAESLPNAKLPAREIAAAAGITILFAAIFALPYRWHLPDGRIEMIHEDLGYYIQQVLGIPEAGVANNWSATLGPAAIAAGQSADAWYHWGPVFLAIGVKSATGLAALSAYMDVVRAALNILLILSAGAIVGQLAKTSVTRAIMIGGLSLVGMQWLKTQAMAEWLLARLPWGANQHFQFNTILSFSYNFEAVPLFASIAAFLAKETRLALLMLFFSAVSAPHTVASVGAAAGCMAAAGFVLRDSRVWKTALSAVAVLVVAWSLVLLAQAGMTKDSSQPFVSLDPASMLRNTGRGFADLSIALVLGALSLPGIVVLIRGRHPGATDQSRLLGLLAGCGFIGCYFAYHWLTGTADRFHVVAFAQTLIIMPAGLWGASLLISHSSGWKRITAAAVITASCLMGFHNSVALPLASRMPEPWRAEDVRAVGDALDGRPFGYFATDDRGWWIAKNGNLGSLLDARCVRLNSLNESGKLASRFYGFEVPCELVPPHQDEDPDAWSLRFARRLGIRHVIETWQDRLPKSIKARSKLVARGPNLVLYELPGEFSPALAVPLPSPAAKAPAP